MVIFGLNVIIKMAKIDGKYIKYYVNCNIWYKCYYKNYKKIEI